MYWLLKLTFFLLALVIFSPSLGAKKEKDSQPSYQEFLPPLQKSDAYRRYTLRPKSEMSKILYLLDRFLNSELQVIYDGTTYDSNTAVNFGRYYVSRNYRNENAAKWIKKHAYRSNPKGKIIYIKFPNGKTRPLRDVLLEELKALEVGHRYQPIK